METLITIVIAAIISLFFLRGYLKSLKKRDQKAKEAAEKGKLFSEGPKAQHPKIDTTYCIGCATCTTVCPEGDVLAMIAGKAVIVNGYKCIGHGLCAEACPVGAITMVMASPSMSADMPYLSPEFETSVPNLFIIGELGGLALIKNAVNQGRECLDTIASRLAALGPKRSVPDVYDVLIVGAGPAGITASLRAIEHKLKYITIERDEVGGTVAKYPRQKLVMTSPVEFPLYGKFKKLQLSKENLLAFWDMILNRADFNVSTGEKVEDIKKGEDGVFNVITANNQYRSHAVVLALGRAGEPRKLGVKGEELPKVMYRLLEADHYVNKKILVVGGGDSAVEAAMGLAHQIGNQVTLSYRSEHFSRIKERNSVRLEECVRTGKLKVLMNSSPVEFKEEIVILDVKGERQELPNDFVWIFAGGIPPNDFLKKIGVRFGNKDMTLEASKESKEATAAQKQLVELKSTTGEFAIPRRDDRPKAKLGVTGEDLPKVAHQLTEPEKYQDKNVLIVGGSDTAVEAALTLARSGRNSVTLCYRGHDFQLANPQNRESLDTAEKAGKVRVARACNIALITADSVVVNIGGNHAEIPNDHVFILIGDSSAEFVRTTAIDVTARRASPAPV
jgi:thioredoxin reductase/Pyruvate/2-oxoacid:ferredoxin oxidoreductase delta subunit